MEEQNTISSTDARSHFFHQTNRYSQKSSRKMESKQKSNTKDSPKTMTGAIESIIKIVFPKETYCFSWKNKVFY